MNQGFSNTKCIVFRFSEFICVFENEFFVIDELKEIKATLAIMVEQLKRIESTQFGYPKNQWYFLGECTDYKLTQENTRVKRMAATTWSCWIFGSPKLSSKVKQSFSFRITNHDMTKVNGIMLGVASIDSNVNIISHQNPTCWLIYTYVGQLVYFWGGKLLNIRTDLLYGMGDVVQVNYDPFNCTVSFAINTVIVGPPQKLPDVYCSNDLLRPAADLAFQGTEVEIY